ncbi:MAG: VWA domain-containing protein [Acidobacteria bacterium]|nr:VWA domain-containing protein [Acidobacteriota bacterium]
MTARVVPLLICALLGAPEVSSAQILSGLRNRPSPREIQTIPLDTNVSSGQRPTFRLKVTRVEVSALVLDTNGQPVRDLAASDFEILDDGRPQTIQSFAAYTYHGGAIPLDAIASSTDPEAAAALVTNAWTSSSRVIGLLIDDLHIDARNAERARQVAGHLLARLSPSDLLFVGLTSTPAISTVGFVRDRRRAAEIVASFGGLRLPDPTLEMRQSPQVFTDSALDAYMTPGLAASEQQRSMRLQSAYDAIGRIAHAVRGVTGRRKSLIFLTEGSPIGSSTAAAGALTGDTAASMVNALAAASVADLAVYPMNPVGLDLPTDRLIEGFTRQVHGTGRDILHEDLGNVITQYMQSKNQLRDLASLTGGTSLIDHNDLASAVGRVLRDASDYYVLAYEPDKEVKGGRVRPISVRVTRPGVTVHARRGYMPPPVDPERAPAPSGLSPEMRTLLTGVLPADALPMVVQMFPIGEHGGKVRYAVVSETAGGPLVTGLDGDTVGIEQAILSMDANGKIANATQKNVELKVGPALVGTLGQLGVRTIWSVELTPGSHQIRLATVHRQSGRGGSMYLDVAVEAGRPLATGALRALAATPRPTAFIDPHVKTLMEAGSQ